MRDGPASVLSFGVGSFEAGSFRGKAESLRAGESSRQRPSRREVFEAESLRGRGLRGGKSSRRRVFEPGCGWVVGFRSCLRPSVIVVPVRGSGRRVCLSAAGLRVHNPAPPQASSTPAGRNKSQIKSRINGKIKSQIKIKDCDEEPAPPAGLSAPSGNWRNSIGWPSQSQRRRSLRWCGSFPSLASSAPRGTAPNPGSKVRALRSGVQAAAAYSANLTPENRHCRQSPADATEGNEPKTDRRSAEIGGAGLVRRWVQPPVWRLATRQSRRCAS